MCGAEVWVQFQASRRDASFRSGGPGAEAPGYCQVPLRGNLFTRRTRQATRTREAHSSTGARSNSGSGLPLVSRSQARGKCRGAMSENSPALQLRVSPKGYCVPEGRLKGSARTHDQLWKICVVVGEGAWGNFQQGIQVFFEAAPHCFINVLEAERLQASLCGPHGEQHFRLAAHGG